MQWFLWRPRQNMAWENGIIDFFIKRILPDAEAILHHISILAVIELNFFIAVCVVLWFRFVMTFSAVKTRVQFGCFLEIGQASVVVAGEWLPLSPFFPIPLRLFNDIKNVLFVSTHEFFVTFTLFVNPSIPLKGWARKKLLGAKLLTRVSPLHVTNLLCVCGPWCLFFGIWKFSCTIYTVYNIVNLEHFFVKQFSIYILVSSFSSVTLLVSLLCHVCPSFKCRRWN